jgi:predicted transcriptional regulator
MPLPPGSGRKKFKIELEDAEGGKYNLSFEGNLSKDKIVKIVEFMDLLNIEAPPAADGQGARRLDLASPSTPAAPASVGDRIWALVDQKFPYGSFTSSDILELYEDTYNEPIKLSIISTYLSRYAERGRLGRVRQGKEWVYRSLSRQQAANAGAAVPRASSQTAASQPQQQQPSQAEFDRLL